MTRQAQTDCPPEEYGQVMRETAAARIVWKKVTGQANAPSCPQINKDNNTWWLREEKMKSREGDRQGRWLSSPSTSACYRWISCQIIGHT